MRSRLCLCALALLLVVGDTPSQAKPAPILAFPGAEGFGALTRGGRGGSVLLVTTLADYVPKKEASIGGSLRAALDTKGPRTIVFRVSGNIDLKAPLDVRRPYVTIAGQSAPGGGVCLRGYGLRILTDEVIVRHLRIRPGAAEDVAQDALWIANASNVIVDHCSVSWATDETLSVTRNCRNVTVQWCLIAESLHRPNPERADHGHGSIIGAYDGGITFHHNIYAHHRTRNPRAAGYEGKPGPILEFRHNTIHNWGDRAGYTGAHRVRINYVGNYLQPGPATKDADYAFTAGGEPTRIFASGNVLVGNVKASRDNGRMVRTKWRATHAKKPFPVPEAPAAKAKQAHTRALEGCGASPRDAVDARVIETVRRRTGSHIDTPADVGGWPQLAVGNPPADKDADAMPDTWERSHGLDPTKPNEAQDADADGYTDLEEYLNGTDPRRPERQEQAR